MVTRRRRSLRESVITIPLRLVYAWRPKVEETIEDVRLGALSFAKGVPIQVSRLDLPRGAFFVIDGHHRVVEAVKRGDRVIRAIVDAHVPRIERTGGAHRSYVEAKVCVLTFVNRRA